jgi:hypothetical protein
LRITTAQLVRDPVYRQFLRTPPVMPPRESRTDSYRWYYYALREQGGAWARVATRTYGEAYVRLRGDLPRFYDVVISSRSVSFQPPKIGEGKKAKPWSFQQAFPDADSSYRWCFYCRRPTRFLHFLTHHALPLQQVSAEPLVTKRIVVPDVLRCEVCGVGE